MSFRKGKAREAASARKAARNRTTATKRCGFTNTIGSCRVEQPYGQAALLRGRWPRPCRSVRRSGCGLARAVATGVEFAPERGEDLVFADRFAEQVDADRQGAAGGEHGFGVAGHVDHR